MRKASMWSVAGASPQRLGIGTALVPLGLTALSLCLLAGSSFGRIPFGLQEPARDGLAGRGPKRSGGSAAGQAWARWAERPAVLRVGLQAVVWAETDAPFFVSAGGRIVSGLGAGCSTSTNAPWLEIPVKPNQPVRVQVFGETVRGVRLILTPPRLMDLGVSKFHEDRPALPVRYRLLVDGEETCNVEATQDECESYHQAWLLEVRPDSEARRLNAGGRDEETDLPPEAAPGDGGWLELGPGRSDLPELATISWSVGLGRLSSGQSAGRVFYSEQGLSSNSYSPAALFFHQPFTNHSQVTVVTNPAIPDHPVLRQIRTPQALLDVVEGTDQFELRFFLLSHVAANPEPNGSYAILTNTPFVTWRFRNPDQSPSLTRRLILTEERPGLTSTNTLTYDSTNQIWSLTRGVGPEERRETRAIFLERNETNLPNFVTLTLTNRYETNRIADAAGNALYEAVETYHWFDWGWELVQVVVDPASHALTTTFHYYTDSNDAPWDRGKLKRIDHPDGSRELRRYQPWVLIPGLSLLGSIIKPHQDTNPGPGIPDWECEATLYSFARRLGDGRLHLRSIERYGQTNFYRYDTIKMDFLPGTNLLRETIQAGWLPSCSGARVRDGAIRYPAEAPAVAAGQYAQTLTNYSLGLSNTFEAGTLSNGTFLPGDGPDWRKTTVWGQGSLYDGDDAESADRLTTLPGKSTKECEIRQGGALVRTEYYAYQDPFPNGTNFALLFTILQTNDPLGRPIGRTRVDAATGASRTLATMDWTGTNQLPGPLLLSETDEDGLTTRYTYDSLKRLKTKTLLGAAGQPDFTVTFLYDAADRLRAVQTNAATLTLSNQFFYDRAGRLTRAIDPAGLLTDYAYPDNGLVTSVTLPGGATRLVARYLSGQLRSETGTAVVPQFHDYQFFDTDQQAPLTVQKRSPARAHTRRFLHPTDRPRFTTTYYNLWDSPILEVRPGYSQVGPSPLLTNHHFYANYDENLTASLTPGAHPGQTNTVHYAYDATGQQRATWLYVDGAEGLERRDLQTQPASRDRLTTTDIVLTNLNGAWFRVTTLQTYLTDASPTPTRLAELRERLNGFSPGVKAQVTSLDVHSNLTLTTTYLDRSARRLTTVRLHPQSSLAATQTVVNGLLLSETSPTVATPTQYRYDALRRLTQLINPQGRAQTVSYDPATGRVAATTDFAGHTTTYEYYSTHHLNAGRLRCQTAANGQKTYSEYNARGQVTRTWGGLPYPEERVYNDYGELVELRTYRGGSGWQTGTWPATTGPADVTTWSYHEPTGLQDRKEDALEQPVQENYFANGRRHTRTWARGVMLTNSYNALGDLERVDYTDGTPSVLFTNYNRAGQPRLIRDGSGHHLLAYDHASRLLSEACTNGLLAGLTVSNQFNPLYGREGLSLLSNGVPLLTHTYGYDSYGRLHTAASGVDTAAYTYLPDSDRLAGTTFRHDSATVLATTRLWEGGERLQSILNVVNGVTVSARHYLYDAVHRRTQATLEDGSLWKYTYNDRNEVIAGKRYWPDWTPVAGQQFEYGFDNIGNRTQTKVGGDDQGTGLRAASYAANALNQYASRTVPGAVDVCGAAYATAAVTVNGQPAGRRGEYFHRAVPVSNGSGPVYPQVTVSATEGGNNTTQDGNMLVAPGTQTFEYDLDGNLTSDGLWVYAWDGENRLRQMESAAGVPAPAKRKLVFGYDYLGRRVSKTVSNWVAGAWALASEQKFLYDLSAGQAGGWNLLAILTSDLRPLTSFLWGQDLSGTIDGAGGGGGLLAVSEISNGQISDSHFPAYDGNGNITALVKASDASPSARYEYGPFGEPIRVSGPFAQANPFRWSTKFWDAETDLVYYGYRYYSPALARWINRDPIEEEGGLNLYALLLNSPLNNIDPDGRNLIDAIRRIPTVTRSTLAALLTMIAVQNGIPGAGQGVRQAQQSATHLAHAQDIRRGINQTARRGSSAAGIIIGFSLVATEAMHRVIAAAIDTVAGIRSSGDATQSALTSFLVNISQGDQGMADLDAVTAALEMTGGVASDAIIAWDVFQLAGEVFGDLY